MTPEEIEVAEFFVGMRGYERAEVRAFLSGIASHHRSLLARIAELEERAAAPASIDPVDQLGAQVAGIVRAAQDAAESLLAEARRQGEEITDEAKLRRAEADELLRDAHAEADRLRREAEERRTAAEQIVRDARAERDRIRAACDDVLTKLSDAVSGTQMALFALRSDADAAPVDLRDGAEAASPQEAWQG